MVTGLAVNVLALGLSSYLLRGLFGGKAPVINLATLDAIRIPWLSNLPVIGHALFGQSLLTYTAFLLVVPMHFFFDETQTGLMLRAVGENPAAAFSWNGSVRVRIIAIVAGGAFAGRRRGSFSSGVGHLHGRHDERSRIYRLGRSDHRPLASLPDNVRLPSLWSGLSLGL